jgi:hypothetical protein
MTHIDEDTLLKYHLEMLEPTDAERVRDHLLACGQCMEVLEALRFDTAKLSAVEIRVGGIAAPPLPDRGRLLAVASRAAAILIFGFLAGYITAETFHPVAPIAVQQHLVPNQLAVPASDHVACQAVDIKALY